MVQHLPSQQQFTSEQLLRYMDLFVGRSDDCALQTSTGRYVRTGRPLTRQEITRHLRGEQTLATYVIDERGCCRFCVFDDDTGQSLHRLTRLQSWLTSMGYPTYLEASRRGGHLWAFFDRSVPASQVRDWFLPFCPPDMEFYPKQSEGRGYGSAIRLPLGLHQLTGRRYSFVQWNGSAHAPTSPLSLPDQLTWLARVQRITVPTERCYPLNQERSAPHTQQSMTYSALRLLPCSATNIAAWCAMQDPFKVIGSYIPLSAQGVACCPFGDHHSDGRDSHPSFKVYEPRRPGGTCWHCYTWGKGGSVFDFLCFWYRVNASTMWRMIQAGEV